MVISAGDSLAHLKALDPSPLNFSSGKLYLTADDSIEFVTSTASSPRYTFRMTTDGAFEVPNNCTIGTNLFVTFDVTARTLSSTTNIFLGTPTTPGQMVVNGTLSLTSPLDGQGNPTTALTVGGNLVVTGRIFETSDFTVKRNISKINKPLDIVHGFNGVKFQMKNSNKTEYGFIAQEVERVAPELVETGPDGLKSVNYARTTAILLEAVKELSIQVETLKQKIEG